MIEKNIHKEMEGKLSLLVNSPLAVPLRGRPGEKGLELATRLAKVLGFDKHVAQDVKTGTEDVRLESGSRVSLDYIQWRIPNVPGREATEYLGVSPKVIRYYKNKWRAVYLRMIKVILKTKKDTYYKYLFLFLKFMLFF